MKHFPVRYNKDLNELTWHGCHRIWWFGLGWAERSALWHLSGPPVMWFRTSHPLPCGSRRPSTRVLHRSSDGREARLTWVCVEEDRRKNRHRNVCSLQFSALATKHYYCVLMQAAPGVNDVSLCATPSPSLSFSPHPPPHHHHRPHHHPRAKAPSPIQQYARRPRDPLYRMCWWAHNGAANTFVRNLVHLFIFIKASLFRGNTCLFMMRWNEKQRDNVYVSKPSKLPT